MGMIIVLFFLIGIFGIGEFKLVMKPLTVFFLLFFTVYLYAQNGVKKEFSIAEEHTIYSEVLGEERALLIYQPQGFWGMDEGKSEYPVIIVLDGESQFLNVVSTVDFLSAAPLGNDIMPQSIIVGIPNTNRDRDFTPYSGMLGSDSTSLASTGGGPAFLDFIVKEIFPYLEKNYKVSEHKTIIGHSLGGLAVFQALLRHRSHFDNYLAIDPALGFDNQSFLDEVIDTLRVADLSDKNMFFATANSMPTDMAQSEIANDDSELLNQIVKANIEFLEIAESEPWRINLASKYYDKESHFSVPLTAGNDGFRCFYPYYRFKEMMNYLHPSYAERTDLVEKLKKHYATISSKLGYEVFPMQSYLNSWAGGLQHYGRLDLVVDLYDYAIELYPMESSALNTKAYFMQNQGQNEKAIALFEKSLELQYDETIIKAIEALKNVKKE